MSDFFSAAARPRVLVHGLIPAEIEAIRPLCGSLRETDDKVNVHPEEHDVLITTSGEFSTDAPNFPRRIVFARPVLPEDAVYGRMASASGASRGSAHHSTPARVQGVPASKFDLTGFTNAQGLASLVRASCLPGAGERYKTMALTVFPERRVVPFVVEQLARPSALASLFERNDQDGFVDDSVIWLPDRARPYLADWLRWAFSWWRPGHEAVFPESAEWEKSDRWATRAERDARATLDEFDAAEDRRRQSVEVERGGLSDAVDAAAAEGDRDRSLLKETGDALVEAVTRALKDLGFVVTNVDELPGTAGRKREDLRVADGAWVAVVEVKGYGKSAKTNDLMQVAKAVTTYSTANGREPDAAWLVVNAYRDTDPSQRPLVMVERPDEIESFADTFNGLVIDTRDLFTLWQAVTAGEVDAEAARAQLRESSGRFATK